MSSDQRQRISLLKATVGESMKAIEISAPKGAKILSQFFNCQPPALTSTGRVPVEKLQLIVEFGETVALTRQMLTWNPEQERKVMVLNMADDERVAGNCLERGGQTQEDELCQKTTLYVTLNSKKEVYPFSEHSTTGYAALYSPGVVIFKKDLQDRFATLPKEQRKVISVLSMSAQQRPRTVWRNGQQMFAVDSDVTALRNRLRMIYRITAMRGKTVLVLGAFGCGAFRCPPWHVATEMKRTLLEEEFSGHFESVYWFVSDSVVYKTFHDVIVKSPS